MNAPPPPRALYLRSALRYGATAEAAAGLYDPTRNERLVQLGDNHASLEARMVSLHESFHAFLNASTNFGNAMMFAAALAEIGEPRCADLVERMIDASLETHETFATIAALCAATDGAIDPALLAHYPDYQGFLDTFNRVFGTRRTVLCVMALTSCARVAMQTNIYSQLLALPCEAWPDVPIEAPDRPDRRFAHLLSPDIVGSAAEAVDAMLANLGGPLGQLLDPSVDGPTAQSLLRMASPADVDRLSQESHRVFAHALSTIGVPPPDYNEQRNGLEALMAKLKAHAGDRLLTDFRIPTSIEEDVDAVIADFRRERLVLREEPDLAWFIDPLTLTPRVYELFAGRFEEQNYLQLVALPKAKALALYRPDTGHDLLVSFPDEIVTGLRRRFVPEGSAPRVEILLLPLPQVRAALAAVPHTRLLPVVCSSAAQDGRWMALWQEHVDPLIDRCLVMIDTDPFLYVEQLGARGVLLTMASVGMRSQTLNGDSLLEVLCVIAEDRPGALFFIPCSRPMREAVANYATRKGLNVSFEPGFLQAWRLVVTPAFSHLLREESRFGSGFWVEGG